MLFDLGRASLAAVTMLALALAASVLLRNAPSPVAEACCASRLDPDRGLAYGALPADVDTAAILARALPEP